MKISKLSNTIINVFVIVLCVLTLFPVLLTMSISFTAESSIVENGYALIPRHFSLDAYKYIWETKDTIFRAYGVTIFITVLGTILAVINMSLIAYALSRRDFKYRNFISMFIFLPMMFYGGLVAQYMVYVNIYHLADSIWALILPSLTNAWYIVILRTFFQTSVPTAIIESGKLDGAGELRIFVKLVLPIALPGVATIALFKTLEFWNEYFNALMYITDPDKYTLQFLLQNMLENINALRENSELARNMSASEYASVPSESARMALCLIAMGPILVVYPFFQKYFIQGLTIGAVKG